MNPESCLLTNFIHNNNIVSSCDFIPDNLNKGTVIYEVTRVINGIPLFYQEHIERFLKSINNSGFEIKLTPKSIALRIKALIESNKLEEGNIRFQISFTDDFENTFSAWVSPFFYPGKDLYKNGASLSTIVAQRQNPNIKTLNQNLRDNISAHIRKNNIYEMLLISEDGLITEGSRSNIFFVKNNEIFTPTTSLVLPGITRSKVFCIAKESGINCTETDIYIDSLSLFDGTFITGTSPKVLPVLNIDSTFFDHDNAMIKTIMNKYDTMVKEDTESFSWERYIK